MGSTHETRMPELIDADIKNAYVCIHSSLIYDLPILWIFKDFKLRIFNVAFRLQATHTVKMW